MGLAVGGVDYLVWALACLLCRCMKMYRVVPLIQKQEQRQQAMSKVWDLANRQQQQQCGE
jgi:hypothetical protein